MDLQDQLVTNLNNEWVKYYQDHGNSKKIVFQMVCHGYVLSYLKILYVGNQTPNLLISQL